jgi:butyryl-CoA dehydrogenase
MAAPLLSERELEFMLYEMFDAEGLTTRSRYEDHSRETYSASIATAKTVAEKYFLPFRQKADVVQPEFVDGKVQLIEEIKQANDAFMAAGLHAASADYEVGGMQLPYIVTSAAMAYFSVANGAVAGYTFLTRAAANLISAHGSQEQRDTWLEPMWDGRFGGTMAMTEPGAGSGLADLLTSAEKADDGTYRVVGNKIFISSGDHELNENIVHLVLARVKGAPKGVKGISLFIVPKFLLNDDGSVGEHNDVALAGLFHKMGGRAQTSTALSFGEKGGAQGYLVGEENKGLLYMFHMMNEARVGVGTGAAALALGGYQYSLDYAKERPQGRLPSNKDPLSPPVNIIEHADIRRMLLAQKAYAEGAYSLCLLGSQLMDDEHSAPTPEARERAHLWLDFMTPMIKSWPSKYGPKANYYAIQVLGGAGYTNEHPVEMFYRDNRLNPIHEGTHGIQSLDLLARKLPMKGMAGYRIMLEEMQLTIEAAQAQTATASFAGELGDAISTLQSVTETLLAAMVEQNIDLALSNSAKYLDLFGNVVIAWLWLKQGVVSAKALEQKPHASDEAFYRGKLQAMQYFFRFELPEIDVWAKILKDLDSTAYDMQESWF